MEFLSMYACLLHVKNKCTHILLCIEFVWIYVICMCIAYECNHIPAAYGFNRMDIQTVCLACMSSTFRYLHSVFMSCWEYACNAQLLVMLFLINTIRNQNSLLIKMKIKPLLTQVLSARVNKKYLFMTRYEYLAVQQQ